MVRKVAQDMNQPYPHNGSHEVGRDLRTPERSQQEQGEIWCSSATGQWVTSNSRCTTYTRPASFDRAGSGLCGFGRRFYPCPLPFPEGKEDVDVDGRTEEKRHRLRARSSLLAVLDPRWVAGWNRLGKPRPHPRKGQRLLPLRMFQMEPQE